APQTPVSTKRRNVGKRLLAFAGAAAAIALVTHAGVGAAPKPDQASADPLAVEVVAPSAIPAPPDSVPSIVPAANSVAVATAPSASDSNGLEPNRPPTKSTPKERLTDARAAAKAHPSDARLLHDWAKAAMKSGDLKEAHRAADAWMLHDASPEPKLFLASVLEQSGKHTEAKAIVEEVLEVWPDSVDARKLHARLGAPLPAPDTSAHRSEVAKR
ncbi:MAG TPA: hypothetical protein VF316_03550, partial [Polyangiaceae bacterium]